MGPGLLEDLLREAAANASTDPCTMGYDDPAGSVKARTAVAHFLQREVVGRGGKCEVDIDANDIVISAGLTAVTNLALVSLCEPGDAVLIPAPWYAGFDSCVRDPRVSAIPIPVYPRQELQSASTGSNDSADSTDEFTMLANVDACLSIENLHTAAVAAAALGRRPRVLLLSSPSNPAGRLYSPSAIQKAVLWARDYGIHTVVDEVYAGSVHRSGLSHWSTIDTLPDGGEDWLHTL